MKLVDWLIPIKTVSEANISEHWTKRKHRHDAQKRWINCYFQNERPFISLPCRVILTRLSPRKLDDDNLRMALKCVRDAIANNINPGLAPGRADEKGITWEYGQDKSKEPSVKIEIFNH